MEKYETKPCSLIEEETIDLAVQEIMEVAQKHRLDLGLCISVTAEVFARAIANATESDFSEWGYRHIGSAIQHAVQDVIDRQH